MRLALELALGLPRRGAPGEPSTEPALPPEPELPTEPEFGTEEERGPLLILDFLDELAADTALLLEDGSAALATEA